MEIRISVDDRFMADISAKLNHTLDATGIIRDAFTLLNWAVTEASLGRAIFSADIETNNLKRLSTPSLERIRKECQPST